MAGNVSDFLENKLLENSIGKTIWVTSTFTSYAALFTVSPTDAGGGTEVSGASYARTSITWGTASAGAISNSGAITFPTATGSWGTVVAVAIFDASSGGNMLWWGPLSSSRTVSNGDVFQFATGQLTLTLD